MLSAVTLTSFFSPRRTLFGVIFLISHVASCFEVPGAGNCPRVTVMQNFDVSRFFGRWFEICAYPSKLTAGGSCVYSTYAWSQTNGITVYNKQISFGKEQQYLGTATVVSNGVLGVSFPAYRKNRFFIAMSHSLMIVTSER